MKNYMLFSLFSISLIVGAFPILFFENNKFKNYICYCKAITSGLFISIGLVHFLPGAIEAYKKTHPHSGAVILIICALTTFLMQIIEHTGKKIYIAYDKIHWISYFLLLILSVHSISEGIALGIEQNPKYVITIFLAILFHKGAETFSLLTNIVTHNIPKSKCYIILVFFALMTPIGIIFGSYVMTLSLNANNLSIIPYVNAIAAGTFIYMAIENNPFKMQHNHSISIMILLSLLGFIAMSMISVII